MKSWLCFVVVILFLACNAEVKDKTNDQKMPVTDSVGSIWLNAKDGIIDTVLLNNVDTAFIVKPKPIADDMGDKRKEYIAYIYFTNKSLPILTHKDAIGADLFLNNDLDGDGIPELLLRPEWFSSCWASLNLYSVKNKKWKLIKKGSMYFCSDQYPLSKRIIKTTDGFAMLTDSLADDKFITLKKEIKF